VEVPLRHADVFFYGLFMDEDLLRSKGLRPLGAEHAVVEGFTLRIGERAMLLPMPGRRVCGLVFSIALPEVDRLYSEPSLQLYRPEAVLARLESGGVIAALCYNLPRASAPVGRNPEYAEQLRSVAQKVGLPAEYIAALGD
jgi:hypothetical protein